MRRYVPLTLIAVLVVFVWAMGWHKVLTLESIAANHDALRHTIVQNHTLAVLLYVALYATVAGLSLPGCTVLTLSGGLLFGCLTGAAAAVVGATTGATIVFFLARAAVGEAVARHAGPWLVRLRNGFQKNALSYILFLRLVPAFPFWLVNLAAGMLGVPLRTYIFGTFLGIVPSTLAFASVGAGLDAVIAAAKADYAACMAANDSAVCTLAINTGALFNTQLVAALMLLGALALIQVVWRKRRHRTLG